MAYDLIPKNTSLIDTSSSQSALNKYESNKRLYSTTEQPKVDKSLLNAAIDYRADYYDQAAWNNSLAELQKERESFIDLYGQFYKSGSYVDKSGSTKTNLNPLDAADRKEFAEYLHDVFPAYSVDYFYRNAESFMKQATGVNTNIKGYADHIGKVWNASWANFALGWEAFTNYLGYGVTGQYGTQNWENKKSEMAEHRAYTSANYRKDLGDDKYDFLLAKMLSGTVEQAPQIASMLAQMALTGGVGGVTGYLATKKVISKAAAETAGKVATSLGKGLTFALSMIGDGGSVMSDCTEFGFSDTTAVLAGGAVGLFTGYLETLGDEQLLRPLNDFVDHLLKVDPDKKIVHTAVKSFGERLREGGIKWAKHVAESEITEPIQEEIEYFSELFVKCIANSYEKLQGRGVDDSVIGWTGEQVWSNVKDTLVQTLLSTPLMTLTGLAVSSGLDTILGGNVSQNAPRKYQNKEGATDVVSANNVVLNGIKVDSTIKDGEKANPIKAHLVGGHFVVDGAISQKQNDLLQSGRVIYITQTDNSKLMDTTATVANGEAIDSGATLNRDVADSYLVNLDLSGKLVSYGFEEGRDFWGNVENKVSPAKLVAINHGEATNLFVKISGQEAPIKIAIGEKNSSAESLSTLEKITGVKYEDFQTAEAKEQDVQKRAEEIRAKEQDERKAEEAKKAETKESTEENKGDKPADTDSDPLAEVTEDLDESPADSPDTPKGESVATQALNKLNKVDPEPVRKRISYKDFDFKGKKANNKTYTVEFYTENGQPTNDYNTAKIYGMREGNGRITYVDASKISEAKREELLTLATNNPLAQESTGNNDAAVKSVIDDNKRTEEAKNVVGVESTAEKVETVKQRDEKAKEQTSEVKTEEAQTAKAETNETADTTTANESKAVEETKVEEKETAETPEPVKEREFNVGVDKVQKETKSTTSEAQDATLVSTAMKEVVEQATGEKKALSDVLDKIDKKFVKDLATSKSPEERASVAAKAIAEIDGFESVLKKLYGKDAVLNESTKQDFVNDFVNYINGTGENISENAKIVFDKLSSGVLATYLNDVERNEQAIQKLEGTTAEPKTAEQMAQETVQQEKENAEQKKTEVKKPASIQEWYTNASTPQRIAYNMANQAYLYWNRQATVAYNPDYKTSSANKATIYRNWVKRLLREDINTAYEYLSSYDNTAVERLVAKKVAYDEKGEKKLQLYKGYNTEKAKAKIAEELVEQYSQEKGNIYTFGDLRSTNTMSFFLNKMNVALDDGIDSYFKEILTNLTGPNGLRGVINIDLPPEVNRLVIIDYLEGKAGADSANALSTVVNELNNVNLADLPNRDSAVRNNGKLKDGYTSLIAQLFLNDFMDKYSQTESYNNASFINTIDDWGKSTAELSDLYSDVSLLKGWDAQEKFNKYKEKITEEIRKQNEENNRDRIANQEKSGTELQKLDSDYMKAVESGDVETAIRMVAERAKELGFDKAIPEQVESYTIRTKAAPKKTIKAYKVFFVDEYGRPSALFVNGTQVIPMGVWVDARAGWAFQADNGLWYVPTTVNPNSEGGKTGTDVVIPNEEVRKELIARGFLKEGSIARTITCVAYRPGWHGGDLPFFPQGGRLGNRPDGKNKQYYNPNAPMSNYANIHRWNQVVFEVEFDADEDYTTSSLTEKGNIKYNDMQELPTGGFYKFATNPMASYTEMGSWFISDSMRIVRALSEEECNALLAGNGFAPQEWEGFKETKKGREGLGKDHMSRMDLATLGYTGPTEDAARKTLAPITYDDNGNVIPLSQRFNPTINDIRYQNSIEEQAREGVKSKPELIASSFRYDTEKGKYYITDNVQREVFQVVSAAIPNMTEEQASDIRKTAVFATAFLTSLDEDIQDELVRKSLRHSGDKFLVGDNENMLRLFFNFNDLKDQSSISKNAIGASLTESAKIILGANSNESTIVHESGHIIYNLDPSIRQTAKEAYTEYFKHDKNGDEIRAVVMASSDRFGGMTADEVINSLKAITREDYDYLNEEFKNTEESIMYMLEAHDEGRDTELFIKGNEKAEYSSGIKGLLERLSNIVKKALDTLKRIFHADFLENANDKVYGSFFTNPEEAKQFFKELRAQSREEITLPMRANSIEARALSPSLSVNDRIAPQTVASSIKEAHDGTTVRDDYQSRQQFEELTYVHVMSDEGGNEIVSKWRSGLKDTFATENDITRLQNELQNSGFFYELENQNVTAIPMEEIKRNVAERIAYSTEDYIAFAEKLGQIKDSLRDSKGNLVKEGSAEYNEAMYRLYGYRDITEDGVVNHRAVGLLSKLYMNDPRGRFGRVDSETGQLAKTVKENLRVAVEQADLDWFNYEELSALFNRKLAQYSDNTSYRNVKKNNQYNTKGLNFNTNISTELLESFLNALVRKQGDNYVPRAWKSKESATGFGNYIQGPLIDLVNNAHLDSSAMENGFARNSLTNANDMFIKAAYNNYNNNVTNTINESMYLSDTVTKDFIGAIKQLDGQDMLKGLYGMKLDMKFYEQIEKLFNEKAEKSEATTQALQNLRDAIEAGASYDTVTDIVEQTSLRKAEEVVKKDTSDDQADSKKALAEVKRDLISTVNELNAEREARRQERERASVFLAHYETENEDLKKELNQTKSKLATADRRYEKALANAFTQISQSNIEEIKNNKDAQAVLTAYTAVLNNLRTENKNLAKELENAKVLADKALKESTTQTTIAQAVLKDFTEKGVVPLFTQMVDDIRDKAKSGGTKRVSEKLTALMDLIGTRVPVKSIRTINTKEVFNFREIYTSDISPENYDKYIKNVTDLGMWVKKNMLTATSEDGIYVVSKSVWDLNAEQLVKLQSLISKVNDDSVKYYKEMVKADEEYNAKWVKQIVQELKDYAEIKGKNMNELLVEDSLGTKDAQKGLKSKIGEFANDFLLKSTEYRERFPTLYAYLYGGVDHKGQLWQGMNGSFNDLNKEVRERNDKLSSLLVSELSNTIFYKGKLTEKNLRRNFEELKNSYSTTLGEDVLTDEDKNSVGLHIDEYVQSRKTVRVASVDEDSDSALKVVVKYLADREIELQKTRDAITETNNWIDENTNKINGIYRSIDKLNSQIAILEKAENIQNGGVMMDEDRRNTIKALQEKITNYKSKIEKIENTNVGHREKLLNLQDDYNKISNIGKRPNANMAKYTTQELLGIYMFARQNKGLDHLLFDPSKVDNVAGSVTNNLSIGNVIWVINKFEKDDTFAPLRRVADGMSDIISSKFEQIRDVRYFMTNGEDWIKQEDYYFSFTADNSELYNYGSELDLGIFDKPAEAKPEAQSRLAKVADRFTLDRHKSLRALNLGVLDYAYNSIYKQEYYINMAKPIKNLKALVANEDFQTAMKNAYGRKDGIKQLRSLGKYVNQLGNTQTDMNENVLSKAMRFITANTAVAAMAYRLPSVLQQFPTMLYVLREKHVGLGGMLKALYRATTDKTLYQYSPQMQEIAESSVAYIRKTKNIGTMLGNYTLSKAITMTQDLGLALLDKANGYIANAMWYAYFEGVKQEYIENGKANGLSTDEFIQLCANEATQRVLDITPTQQAKDNSAIYATNNAFVRDLLLFTNQTSKMLNGIISSVKDKDIVKTKWAKTIAITVVISMLNAIINGQMFRKTKDDDDDEAKVNLLKNIPYAIATGFTDLLPVGANILSSDKYGSTDLPVDIQNLFKVIKKDKDDRTEHQLANAVANFVTDSMGLLGLPSTETRSIYRGFRDGFNPGYWYNTKYGELFEKED